MCTYGHKYSGELCQNVTYTSLLIPDSLKTNANAIVREELLEITIKSSSKLVINERRAVTVLNKSGDKYANFFERYDNDTKINKLSIKVYDAFGKEIKKYSKSKFTDVSAVSNGTLYSDAMIKYIDYTPTSYPYTLLFESERENSSTGFIPTWYPIGSYSLAIEKSVYKINNPLNLVHKKQENNLKNFTIENVSTENIIQYQLTNQPAIKFENSSVSFFNLAPSVKIALNNFTLKKVPGTFEDWKSFGNWMQEKLLKDKVTLNEETKAEIRNLVKEAKTDREKAKIVYEYMQNKTRYIGVQVGIGVWEPISAMEVDKMGYGDCKGLSNYTKALLNAIDVAANYTIVYADTRRDIDTEFASIQGNHIILNIPNGGDDIWLECTSQIKPFGFLGRFTEDRNVLVITPEGGVIKRTPAYENETNLQTVKATITLDAKGGLIADVKRVSKGIQYDDQYHHESKSKEALKKHYLTNVWDYNNNLELKDIDIHNDKEAVVYTEKLEVAIGEYASITEKDYLFRVNVFNKYSNIPKRYRDRKTPLEIDWGFLDKDEFTITLPEGYAIGELPIEKVYCFY